MDDFILKRDFVLLHEQVVLNPLGKGIYEISWPQGKKVFKGDIPEIIILEIYADLTEKAAS